MSAKLKTSFEFVEIPTSPLTELKEFQVGFFVGTSFRCKGRFDSYIDALKCAADLGSYQCKPVKIYCLTLTTYEV